MAVPGDLLKDESNRIKSVTELCVIDIKRDICIRFNLKFKCKHLQIDFFSGG
jgi:hypothetical protein